MKRISKNVAESNASAEIVGVEDAKHWTKFSKPVCEEGRAILAEPYDPEQFTKDGDPSKVETAAIALKAAYEKAGEHEFDSASAAFLGLYHLIKHNPHFHPEAHALRMIVEGEAVMAQFCNKVENL